MQQEVSYMVPSAYGLPSRAGLTANTRARRKSISPLGRALSGPALSLWTCLGMRLQINLYAISIASPFSAAPPTWPSSPISNEFCSFRNCTLRFSSRNLKVRARARSVRQSTASSEREGPVHAQGVDSSDVGDIDLSRLSSPRDQV